ncbi:MAG: Mrp/NBP35 family ATP-binding protein [Oscillospiraceae bacterium]|nr:Mrp/NBP35 family ATP-binding protein [Oscillospiraceae bacterium]
MNDNEKRGYEVVDEDGSCEGCSQEGCEGCSGSCEGCSGSCSQQDLRSQANPQSHVKRVIGVVSGKGGVGKSLITSLSAVMMQRRGYKTGVLDADMTGPSIPLGFGIHTRAQANAFGILPSMSEKGIGVMSVNLFLDEETEPVIWRGAIVANTVKQFWTDVVWGDVDYLFVDMPPGTGDVPLTIFQSLPVDGILVVASPQELVGMIVTKAVRMAQMMDIPILGVVENMSWFQCDKCGEKHYIYGKGRLEEAAAKYGLKILARLPIRPDVAAAVDAGKVEDVDFPEMEEVAAGIEEALPVDKN